MKPPDSLRLAFIALSYAHTTDSQQRLLFHLPYPLRGQATEAVWDTLPYDKTVALPTAHSGHDTLHKGLQAPTAQNHLALVAIVSAM
jgi:hypothetical protein